MKERRRGTLHPGLKAARAAERALEDARHLDAFRAMLVTFLEAGPGGCSVLVSSVLTAFVSGVVLIAEACALAAELKNAVRAGDGTYVFSNGLLGRRRCCKLHPIGRRAQRLAKGSSFSADEALRAILDWLQELGPDLFKATGDDRAGQMAAVQRGARCFWSLHLPNVLAKDAEAQLTLRPLRPQALARRTAGQPLAKGAPIAPSLFAACASMPWDTGPIDGSGVMQQVVAIMTTGDGTKLGALRTQQLGLLEPLMDEVEGDMLGLILLTVAAGICEHGTVQEEEPSHSATARYIRELEQMFSAAPLLAASLPGLAPVERRAACDELLQHAGDRSDGRAALTNADMHLCDALGCEPMGALQGEPEHGSPRGTRYLSAAERNLAVKLGPGLAPTPELQAVVSAVVHIFSDKPTRPGDMQDARFEDLEVHKGRVVLNLRRRAGLKGQKTAAAEGPMEFSACDTVAALTALKELRKGQAALDGDPLWGRDLVESRRLYTRAHAILDSVCKHVTGDVFEAVYSFRHGVISDEVFEALMIDDPEQAQAALKRASVRANHRNIETTVEYYFHLAPEVTHKHALRAIGALLTNSIVAKWSGISAHALEQRVYRSQLARQEVMWAAIADAAPLVELEDITLEFPCAPSTTELAKVRLTLDDVGCSNVCTSLRFKDGKIVWDVEEVGAATATPWAQALVDARSRYAHQWEDAVRPASMRQPKLRPLARTLRRHRDSAAVRKATQLWRTCAKRGFLDVSDPASLHAWLTFLVTCGVPPSRLALRVEPGMKSKLEVLNAVFSQVTGLEPSIDGVPGGKGRPPVYLLISSQDPVPGETLPSAATSMAGFNALMLSACIREDLVKQAERETNNAET